MPFHLKVSPRRRSVGLTITETGELLVHAPQRLPLAAIREVVHRHRAWIEKKQAERREAWASLATGKVYYQGQALDLDLVYSGTAGVRLGEGVLQITLARSFRKGWLPPSTNSSLIPRGGAGGIGGAAAAPDPWPLLLRWYYQQAEIFLTERVRRFAPRMGLTPPPLALRDWRRRWGECRPGGQLRFNWRLVLLPPESLDYLVVHELAHLLVPGHPPRFWQEVGKYLPDFAARRRWLRVYGSPFLLWRWAPA